MDLLGAFALRGSTQYAITLKDSKLVGNEVNATALLAAQDNLDVTLSVLGSGEPPHPPAPQSGRASNMHLGAAITASAVPLPAPQPGGPSLTCCCTGWQPPVVLSLV